MTQKEFFNLELPKWSALVVVGKPVTQDQAAEIILRTSSYISCNDNKFVNRVNCALYDLPEINVDGYNGYKKAIAEKLGVDEKDWQAIHAYEDKCQEELGIISVGYLHNSQICSSWIGGPHGWCNWDGSIYTANYNIGKWPSVEEVFNEWKEIAKAFPFLDLKCQLMNHEASCEDMADVPGPVVEFTLKNGKVKMSLPKEQLAKPEFGGHDLARLFTPGGEIGCTIETVKRTIALVKNNQEVLQ
jgi:hypothetical protein